MSWKFSCWHNVSGKVFKIDASEKIMGIKYVRNNRAIRGFKIILLLYFIDR